MFLSYMFLCEIGAGHPSATRTRTTLAPTNRVDGTIDNSSEGRPAKPHCANVAAEAMRREVTGRETPRLDILENAESLDFQSTQ
jgi:hypothetical protein